MPSKPEYRDVDDYIGQQVPAAQSLLARMRRTIHEQVPVATENIKWGQPFFTANGQRASIAAYKAHVSLLLSRDIPVELVARISAAGYSSGQKRLNIRFDQEVPAELLIKLLTMEFTESD
ncbi:iron chaperone [Lacticaseibacillus pantheris]